MAASQPRIAMLSVHSCPVGNPGTKDTGGMSVYIRELAQELGKQGLPVDIYTRVHDPKDDQVIELCKNTRLIHLKAGNDKDIHKLALFSYLPDFACNIESFRKHNNLRYGMVFSHYWLSGWAGESLQHWWDVPHVIMFHTLGAVKNATGIGEDEPELRLETEKHLARNCHHIIAGTEKEKEEFILHYGTPPERISVIPCGVNMDMFQPIDKETAKQQLGFGNDKIILFAGRIEPLKGIDKLIQAMTYLQNGGGIRLVIIGGDEHSRDEMKRLRRLSRDLHVRDSVTFMGFIKQDKLSCFYNAADVCAIPSYYESFGLVALESLACGTPVVATDVGATKSVIHPGETGYVVTDNTPHGLADKIALLLSKPAPDTKSTLSIRSSVARYSWSNIAQEIINKSREIMENHTARVN
ncbi:glycosyltransferase [Chloroflexota bacterium]